LQEYVDVLLAVAAYGRVRSPSRPFVAIEIGCGYCHWLVTAGVALRHLYGALAPFHFTALDAGARAIERCKQALSDNAVSLDGGTFLVSAVVPGNERSVEFVASTGEDKFMEGMLDVNFMDGMLAILGALRQTGNVTAYSARAVNISTLLEPYTFVDYVDIDVQGVEAHAFLHHMAALTAKVKFVHIGTHGVGEDNLINLFLSHHWKPVFVHKRTNPKCRPEHFENTLEYGPICFADGVFAFENPFLIFQ